MINYSKRDFFYKDSCYKNWIIIAKRDNTTVATITNSDLQTESITLTESIGSSDDFVLGRCEPSKFEFTVHNVIEKLKNCTITVDLVLDHDTANPFRVGTYYVDSDKPTANRDFRKVTCYDMAGKLGETDVVNWYDSLTFPMTLKQFRNSFFNYVGITQETVDLVQDNVIVYKTLNNDDASSPSSYTDLAEYRQKLQNEGYTEAEINEKIKQLTTSNDTNSYRNIQNYSISAMTVLNAICELNGCFGHMTRDNKFRYVYLPAIYKALYPADDLFPANDLYPADDVVNGTFYKHYYTSCEYEDFETKAIDGVVIMDENSEIAVATSVNVTNPFKLEGNFLLYDLNKTELQTVAQNLYFKINTIQYSPCKISCVADLCIEVGDSYVFNDADNIVYSYIFTRTMTGLQLLKDEFESRGNEDLSKNLNSINAQLQRLRDKAEWDIDVQKARIGYLEVKEGKFEVLTAEKFTADRADITALYSQTAIISGDLLAANAYIGRVESDVGTFKTLTASNFKAVNANIGTLEAKTATIQGDILSINGNISTINGSIRSINGDISSIEGNISTVNGKISSINGDISSINGSIRSINGDISSVEGDIRTVNGNISTINGTISALRATVNTIDANYITADKVVGCLSGKYVYCMKISASSADLGGTSMSAGSTVGGKAIATTADIAFEINNVKNWCNATFKTK